MRIYETATILQPELTEDQVSDLITKIEAEIEKGSGKIIEIDSWGVRKLAYRIKRHPRGYYVFIKYASPPSLVRNLEYLLRVQENVIRFMTINLEEEIAEKDLATVQKVLKKPEPAVEFESGAAPSREEAEEEYADEDRNAAPESEPKQAAPLKEEEPVAESEKSGEKEEGAK